LAKQILHQKIKIRDYGGFLALMTRGLPPIGLEVGTSNLRIVKLKHSPQLSIAAFSMIKAPVGAVAEGEVVDVEAVSASLARLARNAGLKGKRVVVGVSNQKVVIRLIELPFMDKEELKRSIRYQVQEFIPISVEETILDFQIVKEFRNESDDQFMEVLLVAAQKDMIRQTVLAVEKAGLKPDAIDVSSFALIRSLLSKPPSVLDEEAGSDGDVVALVNIGSGVTDIALAEMGIPRFVRVTPLAGNSFTTAVSEELSISFAEAEELKIQIGLPDENNGFSKTQPENKEAKAQKALEKESLKFATEIRRSFDYYLAQTPHPKKIDQIILSGGGANLKNLPQLLEKEFQTKIELSQLLQHLKVAQGISREEIEREEASLAIPVGLALRGLR